MSQRYFLTWSALYTAIGFLTWAGRDTTGLLLWRRGPECIQDHCKTSSVPEEGGQSPQATNSHKYHQLHSFDCVFISHVWSWLWFEIIRCYLTLVGGILTVLTLILIHSCPSLILSSRPDKDIHTNKPTVYCLLPNVPSILSFTQ